MNKNVILNNKIEEVENDSDEIKGKISRDIAIALLSSLVLILPGVVLKNFLVNLSYPFFSLATIIPTLTIYDIAIRKKMLDENKKEIKHLENIGKKGIKKSKKYDEARYNKIDELRNIQSKKIGKDKLCGFLSAIPLVGWLGASVVSFFIPEALIATLTSVGIMSVLCAVSAKQEKEILELETRMQNLENDLILEPVFGYTSTGESKVKKKTEERKTTSSTKVTGKNEKLVERYLQDLEKKPQEGRKVFEKRY